MLKQTVAPDLEATVSDIRERMLPAKSRESERLTVHETVVLLSADRMRQLVKLVIGSREVFPFTVIIIAYHSENVK